MSKKLLSVFVVLALVLSMVPVVGLPATKANAATFDNSNLVDTDGSTEGMQAVCPHCKGEAVTWTELSACQPGQMRIGNVEGKHMHVYLSDNRTQTIDAQFMASTGSGTTKICLHLNGHNLTTRGQMSVGYGVQFAVMGNGEVTFLADTTTATYNAQCINSAGNTTIYGGTWKNAEGVTAYGAYVGWGSPDPVLTITGDARFVSDVYCHPNVGDVVLDQNAVVNKLTMNGTSLLTVNGTWTGKASVVRPNTTPATNGMFTGDLTILKSTGALDGKYVATNSTTVTRCLASIDDEVWYSSFSNAVNAYTEQDFEDGKVIKLWVQASAATLNDDLSYYIDMNGCNITNTVSGAGTVYLLDSANDTYDATKCGTFITSTATVMGDATVGGKRYVTVEDGTNYTAHRLDMKITHVTLKTAAAGLYFKAEYKCDATLAGLVDAYGIAVSKTGMPRRLKNVGYSELTDFNPVNNTVTGNSGAVIDILLDDANADNLGRAQTMLYANSYITINGKVLMGNDTEAAYSLETVLQAIDTNWANYAGQADTIKAFYTNWATKGATNISSINFNNINK